MHTVKPRELLATRDVCAARRVGGREHGHARVRARVPCGRSTYAKRLRDVGGATEARSAPTRRPLPVPLTLSQATRRRRCAGRLVRHKVGTLAHEAGLQSYVSKSFSILIRFTIKGRPGPVHSQHIQTQPVTSRGWPESPLVPHDRWSHRLDVKATSEACCCGLSKASTAASKMMHDVDRSAPEQAERSAGCMRAA